MKSKFIVIIFYMLLVHTSNSQWEQCKGITDGIWSLATCADNIFAGTYQSGVYISTNDGKNWKPTSLKKRTIQSLVTSGNTVFAGTTEGLFLSTNNGKKWALTSLINTTIWSMTVSNNCIFAAPTMAGVYISTDNGSNWAKTSFIDETVTALASSGDNIFAGTSTGDLYLSTNKGENWIKTSFDVHNMEIYSIAATGNNVFVGPCWRNQSAGLSLSTDNGSNWVKTSLTEQCVLSIVVNGDNYFAATPSAGIFSSSDKGSNWTQKNEGFPDNVWIYSLYAKDKFIIAGTKENGVYRRAFSDFPNN